jgi:alpha-galactosidase
MLEAYVEKWPAARIENFVYMLRSGMLGWLTIMQNTNAWSAQEHAAAKQEIQLYKDELRPLIRDADVYHISPRPDGIAWDGIEFFDPRRQSGVIYAFRGSTETEREHNFKLRGLTPRTRYRLRFHDRSSPDKIVSGREFLDEGLTVTLPVPESSELVLMDEAGKMR